MIKLIASDVDGTLLRDYTHIIPARTSSLIKELVDRGVIFVPASGRQNRNLKKLFSPISDKFVYVSENGSYCTYQDEDLLISEFPRADYERVMAAVRAYDNGLPMVSGCHNVYIEKGHTEFYHITQDILDYRTIEVDDLMTDIKEPIVKVAVYDPRGTEILGPHFANLFHDSVKAVTAAQNWVDFTHANANKGYGIKAIMDHFGFKPKECIAFGDQYNDREMLQAVGTSYVVSSCAPGMEQYATHVCDDVADVLEEILRDLS